MKKKLRKLFTWLIINTGLCYCLYLFGTHGIESAGNILKFALVLNFVLTFLCYCSKTATNKMIEEGLSVNLITNSTFGIAFACALAGYGMFFYAAIDITATIMQLVFYETKNPAL